MLREDLLVAETLPLDERPDEVLLTLLRGTYDAQSPLYALRGGHRRTVLPLVWSYVRGAYCDMYEDDASVGACLLDFIRWPAPVGRDLNVNMMPFVAGKRETLPPLLQRYWSLIEQCRVSRSQHGKVWYLTVHETHVEAGCTQRRPGLHVEGVPLTHAGQCVELRGHGWGSWGRGGGPTVEFEGGVWMAHEGPGDTAVWTVQIATPFVGTGGSVEHLRKQLSLDGHEAFLVPSGTLCWLTDQTPHEALPATESGLRRFFRLVGSDVSIWYSAHSTPNPLGTRPPPSVRIVDSPKFDTMDPLLTPERFEQPGLLDRVFNGVFPAFNKK